MDLGGRRAEPGRLGREVAADLVGVQVCLGVEVADAGDRELPAVGGGAEEVAEHPEVAAARLAVGVRPFRLQPPEQPRDIAAVVAGERLVHLDVGIAAVVDPSEHLQQYVFAEHQ